MKIVVGLITLTVAWIFVFRTGLIYRFNEWIRNVVFSDEKVLFSRRRMAILLFILGTIALFSGIDELVREQRLRPGVVANLLEKSHEDFQKKNYKKVVTRCKVLVKSNPKNVEAWKLLAAAWWTLGDKNQARKALEAIRRIRPSYPIENEPILQLISKEGQEVEK